MSDAYCRFIVSDALTAMREMPDASVDLVLSSPPFLALRSYLPADHPDKAKEMGSEPTPGAYIDALLDIVEECRRVLAPHGSLCLELGDTFAGSGGAGGDYNEGGMRDGAPKFDGSGRTQRTPPDAGKRYNNPWRGDGPPPKSWGGATVTRNRGAISPGGPGWPEPKSLCLIPELLRVSMVYGFNPLTGRETPRWRARNVVRWVRPNPPVGALGDKFRPATTEMVVACMSRDRWFDLDAVRTPFANSERFLVNEYNERTPKRGEGNQSSDWMQSRKMTHAGAPPLDWWEIPTEGFPGSHYATWPRDLCVIPVKAMCPARVCVVCGEPSRRIAETTNGVGKAAFWIPTNDGNKVRQRTGVVRPEMSERTTLGWTDCDCPDLIDKWRAGVVLDPFAGSGTTLAVAQGHGRSAIGIDLDPRNLELARSRIGMFLEEADPTRPTVDVAAPMLGGDE